MKAISLFVVSVITFFAFANCTTLALQNPQPDAALLLDTSAAECTEDSNHKQWYLLYGAVPLNRVEPEAVFSQKAESYRLRLETTAAEAAISIPGGFFLSLTRNTLVVEKCAPSVKVYNAEDVSRRVSAAVIEQQKLHAGQMQEVTEQNASQTAQQVEEAVTAAVDAAVAEQQQLCAARAEELQLQCQTAEEPEP